MSTLEGVITIKRDVKIPDSRRGRSYIFDGLVTEESGTTIIEVKFIRNGPIHRLQDTINRIEGSLNFLPEVMRQNVKLLLIVVTDEDSIDINNIKNQLESLKKKPSIPIEVRLYKLEDLEKEFESLTKRST